MPEEFAFASDPEPKNSTYDQVLLQKPLDDPLDSSQFFIGFIRQIPKFGFAFRTRIIQWLRLCQAQEKFPDTKNGSPNSRIKVQ